MKNRKEAFCCFLEVSKPSLRIAPQNIQFWGSSRFPGCGFLQQQNSGFVSKKLIKWLRKKTSLTLPTSHSNIKDTHTHFLSLAESLSSWHRLLPLPSKGYFYRTVYNCSGRQVSLVLLLIIDVLQKERSTKRKNCLCESSPMFQNPTVKP